MRLLILSYQVQEIGCKRQRQLAMVTEPSGFLSGALSSSSGPWRGGALQRAGARGQSGKSTEPEQTASSLGRSQANVWGRFVESCPRGAQPLPSRQT